MKAKKDPNVLAGRTRTNRLVNFVGPKTVIGEIVYIQITEARTWSLNGKMVEPAEVYAK